MKSSRCVNHGFKETQTQISLVTSEKITAWATQPGLFKFPTKNQRVLSPSLITTIQWERNQILKIPIKPKFLKFSEKTRSIIVSIAN